MPNPLDFLLNPIRRGVGGVRRGVDAIGGQLDPARRRDRMRQFRERVQSGARGAN